MYFADEHLLYNPRLRRAYRIEGGVPVLLAARAEPVPEGEHERLLIRARDGAAVLSASGESAACLASPLSARLLRPASGWCHAIQGDHDPCSPWQAEARAWKMARSRSLLDSAGKFSLA